MKVRSKSRKPSILCLTLLSAVISWTAAAEPTVEAGLPGLETSTPGMFQGGSKVKTVNCNSGETIAKVLDKAEPGDTIRVTGTCFERVTITTDRITLDGQGSATLDGAGSPAHPRPHFGSSKSFWQHRRQAGGTGQTGGPAPQDAPPADHSSVRHRSVASDGSPHFL